MGREEQCTLEIVEIFITSAPARQQVTLRTENADSRHRARNLSVLRTPGKFGDVCVAFCVDHEFRRSVNVRPLGQIFSVQVEDLDSIVLPVTYEKAAARFIHTNAVHGPELTRLCAGFPHERSSFPSGENLWTRAFP